MTRCARFISIDAYRDEAVVTEPGLQDCEKESAIYFSARTLKESYVQVSSNQAPIVRSLLDHEAFTAKEVLATGTTAAPLAVYVAGRLPTSCIRIAAAKSSSSIGKIITQSGRRCSRKLSSGSLEETRVEEPVRQTVGTVS